MSRTWGCVKQSVHRSQQTRGGAWDLIRVEAQGQHSYLYARWWWMEYRWDVPGPPVRIGKPL